MPAGGHWLLRQLLLAMEQLVVHMVLVGAGVLGAEFAC
jgi:hypothetical protein